MSEKSGSVSTEASHIEKSYDSIAIEYKNQGNECYRQGDYKKAIEYFTKAIEIDNKNEVFYCNRSMSYNALKDYEHSVLDARQAIDLRPNEAYVKAYFYLIKGLIELKLYKEAKSNLLVAFNRCGVKKEFTILEEELTEKYGGHPIRPKPNDFDIIEELGEGNFTKIFKAKYKKTGYLYSIKTIDKMTAERTKRRHPNIHNEIMMEKRVLSKLDYPFIVTLYSTFQDDHTLYYQMELCHGGELWVYIKDNFHGLQYTVGCHESLTRFFMMEIINAIEYMHQKGIVHRDIKLENILLSGNGHVKIVDFGTAKDLIQTDLNGPEFVGTPEYMSPFTVKSKPVGIDADLWALGVLFFQLLTGYTPFNAPSPYLSFLRIQRGIIRLPSNVSEEAADIIRHLLLVDVCQRIQYASNQDLSIHNPNILIESVSNDINNNSNKKKKIKSFYPVTVMTKDFLSNLSYQNLRNHAYFHSLYDHLCDHVSHDNNQEERIALLKSIHQKPAVNVASLRDYCIRAIGKACVIIAEAIAKNGGVKPSIPWIEKFNLLKLPRRDVNRVSHYLDRCDRLNASSGVYRLFHSSSIDSKTIRSNIYTREYLGHYHSHHGQYNSDFCFLYLTNPNFKSMASDGKNKITEQSIGEVNLRTAISSINRLRPKFVMVGGNFTFNSCLSETYFESLSEFRRMIGRISDTIPILFIPGENDVGFHPTKDSITSYHKLFGADYYGFWYSGTRILVINSPLLCHPEEAKEEALAQEQWFEEEIEQAKLCSTHLIIFSYHPWFIHSVEDNDDVENESSSNLKIIPKHIRQVWMKRLRHKKVKFLFASYSRNNQGKAFTRTESKLASSSRQYQESYTSKNDYGNESEEEEKKEKNGEKVETTHEEKYPIDSMTGDGVKPSQYISHASLENKELVSEEDGNKKVQEKKDKNSNSSSDHDEENEEKKKSDGSDDENDFVNEDSDYFGPFSVTTSSLGESHHHHHNSINGSDDINNTTSTITPSSPPGLRVIKVYEDDIKHQFYEITSLPTTISM